MPFISATSSPTYTRHTTTAVAAAAAAAAAAGVVSTGVFSSPQKKAGSCSLLLVLEASTSIPAGGSARTCRRWRPETTCSDSYRDSYYVYIRKEWNMCRERKVTREGAKPVRKTEGKTASLPLERRSTSEKGIPVEVVYRARGPALGSWEDQPPAAYQTDTRVLGFHLLEPLREVLLCGAVGVVHPPGLQRGPDLHLAHLVHLRRVHRQELALEAQLPRALRGSRPAGFARGPGARGPRPAGGPGPDGDGRERTHPPTPSPSQFSPSGATNCFAQERSDVFHAIDLTSYNPRVLRPMGAATPRSAGPTRSGLALYFWSLSLIRAIPAGGERITWHA
eukprot:757300-Prorocentrum_minimum.AAC.6